MSRNSELSGTKDTETKKLETWSIWVDGTDKRYKVEVRSCCTGRGGHVVGFRATFPDGTRLYHQDIVQLREDCQKRAEDMQGWKFEYVIRIQVTEEWDSSRGKDGENHDSAELGITWRKLRKVKGKDLYYSVDSDSIWSHDRGAIEIPWTEERQAALESACANLRRVKEKLDDILSQKHAAKTLDAAVLGKLLPSASVCDDKPREDAEEGKTALGVKI